MLLRSSRWPLAITVAMLAAPAYLVWLGGVLRIGLGFLGFAVLLYAVWDTLATRLVLGQSELLYRDHWFRIRRLPYRTTTSQFDPALGLFIFENGNLVLRWPPRSANVAQFNEALAERIRHAG